MLGLLSETLIVRINPKLLTVFSIIASLIVILVVFSVVAVGDNAYGQASIDKNRKIEYYGCVEYVKAIHCDPLHNNQTGYAYQGASIPIYDLQNSNPIFVDGKYDKAFEVKAPYREAVHVPSISNITFNDFSVSFWVKGGTEPQPIGQVISYANSENSAGWFFEMSSLNGTQNSIRFVLTDKSGKLFSSPDAQFRPNDFHNIIGTFNGSNIAIYVDGRLSGQTSYTGNYSGSAGVPLTIGSASYCASCNRWSGIIDDLRIYGRAVTSEEVEEVYGNPDILDKIPLIAYWTFDGQFIDSSGNNNTGYESTLLASMAFTPDDRLFYSEKNTGLVRIMKDEKVLEEPFARIDDYYVNWEQGLLGITIDPKYSENHYVYLYYTRLDNKTGEVFGKIVRFTDDNNVGVNKAVILDNIFAEKGYHAGGALMFGPDDKLYVTVGDATEHPFAQDSSIVVGKTLRINRDGTIPSDNPFPNSPIYTLGHRNMYGLAFDNYGNGLASENGDYYYDEVNLLQKGGNYGFPLFQPANISPELSNSSKAIKPLRSYWDTIAPTQMIHYSGNKIPVFVNKFLLGSYQGDIYALHLDNKTLEIDEEDRIDLENYPFKPVVGIAESSRGDVYFGAYTIYKLNSTKIEPKDQYLFPIAIDSPSASTIKEMQYSDVENKLTISLQNTKDIESPSYIGIQIPKALISNVTGVVNTYTDKAMDFTENKSTNPNYNSITIQLPHTDQLNIDILGSTVASAGEQVLRG